MHPVTTVKTWAHNVHMMHVHEMAQNASKLLHDGAFWALVILVTLFVAAFMLVLTAPTDVSLKYAPMYPFPVIM